MGHIVQLQVASVGIASHQGERIGQADPSPGREHSLGLLDDDSLFEGLGQPPVHQFHFPQGPMPEDDP